MDVKNYTKIDIGRDVIHPPNPTNNIHNLVYRWCEERWGEPSRPDLTEDFKWWWIENTLYINSGMELCEFKLTWC